LNAEALFTCTVLPPVPPVTPAANPISEKSGTPDARLQRTIPVMIRPIWFIVTPLNYLPLPFKSQILIVLKNIPIDTVNSTIIYFAYFKIK
jgi:hypothetical protein